MNRNFLTQLMAHRHFVKLARDTHGGVVALTAMTLPVVVMISALSVDLGILYLAKSKAESVAIFSAESGLERMPDEDAASSLARRVADAMLENNSLVHSHSIEVSTEFDNITVDVQIVVNAIFSKLAGTDFLTVNARTSLSY